MVKLFVCRLCLLMNFIFLFNSENISFYHCAVKYEIVKLFLILILLFSLFEPLLWTIRPCLHQYGCMNTFIILKISAETQNLIFFCKVFILKMIIFPCSQCPGTWTTWRRSPSTSAWCRSHILIINREL